MERNEMLPNQNEAIRQRLLEIRAEFRRRLGVADGLPQRNRAVFYSGTSSSLESFRNWLALKNPAFVGAKNLESLPAGEYLVSMRPELERLFGTNDFDVRKEFSLPGGGSFSGSINGMWRELSARYARACSGVVHVLVSHDRAQLHQQSLKFWADRQQSAPLPLGLKVFGFVELPILVGLLSDNKGVTAVNIYAEHKPGSFSLLSDGKIIIGQRAGNA